MIGGYFVEMAIIDPQATVKNKLYEALEVIDAPTDLLQIVGSWGDTMPAEETIRQLDDFIAHTTGKPPRAAVAREGNTLEEIEKRVRAPDPGDRA